MSSPTAMMAVAARTLLFVPGDRPDRFDKAMATAADGVILDLEDAVSPTDKDSARAHVAAWLARGNSAVVRINAADTAWFADDLAAIRDLACTVMLPKATVADVAAVSPHLCAETHVVALIETAAGIIEAPSICAVPKVIRAAFGSVDLGSELGIDPDDREALRHARSALVLASAAAGIAGPIDGVTTDLANAESARADGVYAARLGFAGKLCIHPMQVGPVNAAFDPTPEQITWARAVVDATEGRAATVNGHMVDEPVLRRARGVLSRHAGAHRQKVRSHEEL